MTILRAVRGDITAFPEADAIVNAGNESLCGCFTPGHRCLDHQIHERAGLALTEECQRIMRGRLAEPSACIVTSAYSLPNKYIIHAYGPNYYAIRDWRRCEQLLADTYRNALYAAAQLGVDSIAFPTISTGLYGYPKEQAAQVAVSTVRNWTAKNPSSSLSTVHFVMFEDRDEESYAALLDE